ncbi:hypothetical protein L1887_20881 [Cichorium endivia]|nr:hypothetical protein L1887_20881 [Cichorium endivia]
MTRNVELNASSNSNRYAISATIVARTVSSPPNGLTGLLEAATVIGKLRSILFLHRHLIYDAIHIEIKSTKTQVESCSKTKATMAGKGKEKELAGASI